MVKIGWLLVAVVVGLEVGALYLELHAGWHLINGLNLGAVLASIPEAYRQEGE